jgi:hypothetical protein
MVDADQRLEGGSKPLRYPVRRPDVAGLIQNPLTQNPGHPRLGRLLASGDDRP